MPSPLDWPAFGAALWKVSDTLGIRPEWQLPVLALETGGTFNPAITNHGGCVGLNQLCPGTYEHYVQVPPSEYGAWAPSAQLAGPVLAYWQNALRYGRVRSATRLMLAQLKPAYLGRVRELESVVYRAPTKEYEQNRRVFDVENKGAITLGDLARTMRKWSGVPIVRDAIAQAYTMRPGEIMTDPVYGNDFERIRPPRPTPAPRAAGASILLAGASAIILVTWGVIAADALLERERWA